MREESLVTAVHDCADVSRVCEEECGTWVRSVLFCHQNWFEVIETLGKCSILASCTQLQFTCQPVNAQSTLQSTLSLRYSLHYSLRYRNSGRRTVLWFSVLNICHVTVQAAKACSQLSANASYLEIERWHQERT